MAAVAYCGVTVRRASLNASDYVQNRLLKAGVHKAYQQDRLDWLQCIWRHTAIWARRERSLTAYSTDDTTVYLFIDTTSHSVSRPHRFVYFCAMTQQNVDGSDRRNLFFSVVL